MKKVSKKEHRINRRMILQAMTEERMHFAVGGDGSTGDRTEIAEGGGLSASEAAPFRYGAVGWKTKVGSN